MLKLTIERQEESDIPGWNIMAGASRVCYVCDTYLVTRGYHVNLLQGGTDTEAASLLHALELGVAAAARWIAVELLRDPAPPAEGEEVEGAVLWLVPWDRPATQLRVSYAPLGVYDPRDGTLKTWWHDVQFGRFAAEEQALAALISHAAPWIAVALVKELDR